MPGSTEYMRQYIRAWVDRRKADALAKLGGKCVACGATEGLQFDHINPAEKFAPIGRLWTASKAMFERELYKCQLLCYVCHQAKTRVNREWYYRADVARHGTLHMYTAYKCRCVGCVKARHDYDSARRPIRNAQRRARTAA